MRKPDTIRRKQLASMGFVGLLSPIIRLLPRQVVEIAGNAAWIAPIISILPVSLFICFMNWFLKNRLPGEGLGHLFLRALGSFFGRLALLLFTIWLLCYAGFTLRVGADRFISTVYPNSRPWAFVTVMLLLSFMATLCRLQTLGRSARIFCPILISIFGLIFVFSVADIDIKNLMPVSYLDIDNILLAVVPILNTVSIAVYTAFLSGRTNEKQPLVKIYFKWAVLILVIITLLVITSLGTFGAELTTKISHPFLVMIRGISLTSPLERIEAVVIAFWVVTDFMLVSTFLFICIENLYLVFGIQKNNCAVDPVFSLKNGRWVIWLCCMIVAVITTLATPTSFTLYKLSEILIPFTNFSFVFVLLPLICIIGKLRKKI